MSEIGKLALEMLTEYACLQSLGEGNCDVRHINCANPDPSAALSTWKWTLEEVESEEFDGELQDWIDSLYVY